LPDDDDDDDDVAGSKHVANVYNKRMLKQEYWFNDYEFVVLTVV
jgi:hypothetical protein